MQTSDYECAHHWRDLIDDFDCVQVFLSYGFNSNNDAPRALLVNLYVNY